MDKNPQKNAVQKFCKEVKKGNLIVCSVPRFSSKMWTKLCSKPYYTKFGCTARPVTERLAEFK